MAELASADLLSVELGDSAENKLDSIRFTSVASLRATEAMNCGLQ